MTTAPKKADWLSLTREPALEPALPICDPHHHLWDVPQNRSQRYLLDELLTDIDDSGHNIRSTVFMECTAMYRADGPEPLRPVGETEFVNGIAAMCASGIYGDIRACAAIVSFADLCEGSAVGEVLDAHLAARPRFRGIRHASGWDASEEIRPSHTRPAPQLLEDATFQRGFAELGKRNLTFDAWLYHPQIPEVTRLAQAFPETTIVFDHLGGPLGIGPYSSQRDAIFKQWQSDVAALAQCENVVAKLGGLVMPINGFGFHKQDAPPTSKVIASTTKPYYVHMIDMFGVERCMFESNFPVDKASCSYGILWNAFKRITAEFSPSEKAALYHDTAVRTYNVPA